MFHEKNTFLINLKSRKDRLDFTMIKLKRMNYKIEDINIVEAIDAKKSNKCKKIFDYIKSKNIKNKGCFNPITSIGPIGLLLTYYNILKTACQKKMDYVIIMEDDNYFHPKYVDKIKNIPKLLETNDIIYIGSNQCSYNNNQLNSIKNNNDYDLENIPIAGTFYIAFSKRFYIYLYKYLVKNIETNIYPIDVLINLLYIKTNINPRFKSLVMYPRPVIPEVRDTDNTNNRNHLLFYQKRKIYNFKEYDMFDMYESFNNSVNFKIIIKNKKIYNYIIDSIKKQNYIRWDIINNNNNNNNNNINDSDIILEIDDIVKDNVLNEINKIYNDDNIMTNYHKNILSYRGKYYNNIY